MAEDRREFPMEMGRGFPGGPPIGGGRGGRGGRDRGGWNEGAPWNRRPARRDMDIVDKELNRYQPAFDHVQRYPEGYGGQPRRGGIPRGERGGGRRGGGGWDDNKFDRFINAIEGISGKGGGNITNTFNPTFNPTNVNAGRDIRDTSIIGGGPNTAGRDITGAGGDVETGDGGGGNVVTGPGGTTNPGGTTPPIDDTTPPIDDSNKYDAWIHSTYNELLGRDAGQEGLDYWSGDLEGGQTKDQVISNIKLSDEYKNRQMAKDLAMSMEGKSYGKDDSTYTSGYSQPGEGDFIADPALGSGDAVMTVMHDYYNPTTGKYTQATAGLIPSEGSGWVRNESPKFDGQGNTISDWTYGDPNAPKGTGKINEASLDAWIGPGGALTQSSDEAGKGYFAGIDATEAAKIAAPTSGSTDKLDDRDQKIYDLYTNIFGRNPDKSGFQYWTSGDQDKMSLADIEASFRGGVEAKLRDNVSGTDKPIYQSVDDYLAGKEKPAATDGVPMGSNNASTGQSAPQSLAGDVADESRSLAGDTDIQKLGPVLKQLGLDPERSPDPVGALPYRYERGDIESQVKGLYKDLLGREADAEGLKYWADEIQNNPDNIETNWVGPRQFKNATQSVIDNIMRSEEYQNRKGRTSPPREVIPPTPQPPAPPIGDPGPREPEIRRPRPSLPPIGLVPVAPPMPTPAPKPVTPKVDNWLQDFYTQSGINKGVLDSGAKSYWEAEAAKVGKDRAKEIILGTAKAQNNVFPTR